ncbi:hypothetical protein P5V15_008321 [Pogonomyrmex californicus]
MVSATRIKRDKKLSMLRTLESGRYLSIAFRSWDLYEVPLLQRIINSWAIKTATQLEKPRHVIFALQTSQKNVMAISQFDCNLTNVKLYLKSECYPYDDMNLDSNKNRWSVLYETRVSARITTDTSISSRVSPSRLFYITVHSDQSIRKQQQSTGHRSPPSPILAIFLNYYSTANTEIHHALRYSHPSGTLKYIINNKPRLRADRSLFSLFHTSTDIGKGGRGGG